MQLSEQELVRREKLEKLRTEELKIDNFFENRKIIALFFGA